MSEEDRTFTDVEDERAGGLETDEEVGESIESTEQPLGEEEEEEEEEEPTPGPVIGGEIEEEELEIEEPRPKSRRGQRKKKAQAREPEPSLANMEKQLEKQANSITKLEQEVQPLRKLVKISDNQSKLIRGINTSVNQIGRQIVQIQKVIQKQKVRPKGKGKSKPKDKGKSKPKVKGKSKRK